MAVEIPCKRDCPDRACGCHGTCEKYKKFRAELDADNEQKRIFKEKHSSHKTDGMKKLSRFRDLEVKRRSAWSRGKDLKK